MKMRYADVAADRKQASLNAAVFFFFNFLTRVSCIIYDSACSKGKGTICVIWPYSPYLLTVSPPRFDLELELWKQKLGNKLSSAILVCSL